MTDFTFKFESRESKEHSTKAFSLLTLKGIDAVGNYVSQSPCPRLIASWVLNFTNPMTLLQARLSDGVRTPDTRLEKPGDVSIATTFSQFKNGTYEWSRYGEVDAINQIGEDLEIPELYSRIQEYCKGNPIPNYTPIRNPGSMSFKYEGGDFKPLYPESFNRYTELVNGAPVTIPNLNKGGYSWFMDIDAFDLSGKLQVFTVAKQRCAESNHARGQTPAILHVDDYPFFPETETENERVGNFIDQPLVWNGDAELTATFTDVPHYKYGSASSFFSQWADLLANTGEGAGCFSADHVHDAFGVVVPEGNYYLKEVETMKDVEISLGQCVTTNYELAEAPSISLPLTIAVQPSTGKEFIVGDWKIPSIAARFNNADIPALATESMQFYLASFGDTGRIEINKQFFENVKRDSEYAWGWFCNLACPLMDAGLTHEAANRAAARQFQHVFQIDITQHSHWAEFETQWAALKAEPMQAVVDTDATTNVLGKHWTQL